MVSLQNIMVDIEKKKKNEKKMIRFVRQQNHYSCGPILLFNLLKWANLNKIISYRDIFALTECTPEKGTKTLKFQKALKFILSRTDLKFKKTITKPSLRQIKQYLKTPNNAIILEYFKNEQYLHFILLIRNDQNEIIMINEGAENKKIPIVQLTNNLSLANHQHCEKYPIAWLIHRHQQ